MKKTLTLVAAVLACSMAFVGCASKDNVDSNPKRDDSSLARTDSSYYTNESRFDSVTDSSKTVPDRVESTVDDVIDGGKEIVDDTASTAEDVVDNITK